MALLSKPETLASGAEIQFFSSYNRLNPGTGVAGNWRWKTFAYRILYGTPSPEEIKSLDSSAGYQETLITRFEFYIGLAGSSLIAYAPDDYAGMFMVGWIYQGFNGDGLDSSNYALDARALDKTTIELKGRKTGETIRLTQQANGDRIYTSDQAGHDAYTFHYIPETCPDDYAPAWFLDFLAQNANSTANLGKRAFNRPKPPRSGRITEIPGFLPPSLEFLGINPFSL